VERRYPVLVLQPAEFESSVPVPTYGEVPRELEDSLSVVPQYAERYYPVPVVLPVELESPAYSPSEEEQLLEATQVADVYVQPITLEVLETYYYPYTEEVERGIPRLPGLPAPGIAVAGGVPVATPPAGVAVAREATPEAPAPARRARIVEKVVL
jgi:hypothetical protein